MQTFALVPRLWLTSLTLIALLMSSADAAAATRTFQAITEFTRLDSGAVPYYRDTQGGLDVLAVDASIEAYRDRFARATVTFDGEAGRHNLVLTTLGELDGDAIYRLLINGELVGTVQNAPVSVDYTVQQHIFDDIAILPGDEIAIESLANSNDTIPEGDGFAFARGRWRSLSVTAREPVVPTGADAIDLSVSVVATAASATVGGEQTIVPGDAFTLSIGVQNGADAAVATSPLVVIELPDVLEFVSGPGCSESSGELLCTLAELPADGAAMLSVQLMALAEGDATLVASVMADQADRLPDNNRDEVALAVQSVAETDSDPDPDLDLDSDANTVSDIDAESVPDTDSDNSNGNGNGNANDSGSGSGAVSPLASGVLFLLAYLVRSRRRLARAARPSVINHPSAPV